MAIRRSKTKTISNPLADSYNLDSLIEKYELFEKKYLGAKSVAPTTDNEGGSLEAGCMFFNSVDDTLYQYNGTQWGTLKGDQGDASTVPGPQGDQGIQGIQGATGPQGIQGDTGVAGDQGIQGIQGDQGIQGATGATGATGDTGIQGATGPAGANGLDGADGADGAQGIQGVAGNDGADGSNGIDGAPGDTGPQGPQGVQGLTGDTGATGATGPQGLTGPAGNDGATGATGPQGIQGIQGETGPAGSDGADSVVSSNDVTITVASGGEWRNIAWVDPDIAGGYERASARFQIVERDSGSHQEVHFYASHNFSSVRGAHITVLQNTSYSVNGAFRDLRIIEGGTYDGAVLQVWVADTTSPVIGCKVYMESNETSVGWQLLDFTSGDQIAGLSMAVEVDLTLTHSIQATDDIYVNGSKVYTEADGALGGGGGGGASINDTTYLTIDASDSAGWATNAYFYSGNYAGRPNSYSHYIPFYDLTSNYGSGVSMFNGSTPMGGIIIPTDGKYRVKGSFGFGAISGSSNPDISIRVDGASGPSFPNGRDTIYPLTFITAKGSDGGAGSHIEIDIIMDLVAGNNLNFMLAPNGLSLYKFLNRRNTNVSIEFLG